MTSQGQRAAGDGRRVRLATVLIAAMVLVAAGAAGFATWRLGSHALAVRRADARYVGRQPAAVAALPGPERATAWRREFVLSPQTVIWTDDASVPLGQRLAGYLAPATGLTLHVRSGDSPPAASIQLRLDPAFAPRLGREGYTLVVTPGGIVARAAEPPGLLRAIERIRQLLPPEVFRESRAAGVRWAMPAVEIEDVPR